MHWPALVTSLESLSSELTKASSEPPPLRLYRKRRGRSIAKIIKTKKPKTGGSFPSSASPVTNWMHSRVFTNSGNKYLFIVYK